MKTTSRRAVLIGTAAIAISPAATMAGAAGAEPDPIFAAIERHKCAFVAYLVASIKDSDEPDNGPKFNKERKERLEDAFHEAFSAHDIAAWDLTTIQPTTIAGMVALIRHVEEFNAGALGLDDERSAAFHWPVEKLPDVDGDQIYRFPYDILSNIRRALEAIGALA